MHSNIHFFGTFGLKNNSNCVRSLSLIVWVRGDLKRTVVVRGVSTTWTEVIIRVDWLWRRQENILLRHIRGVNFDISYLPHPSLLCLKAVWIRKITERRLWGFKMFPLVRMSNLLPMIAIKSQVSKEKVGYRTKRFVLQASTTEDFPLVRSYTPRSRSTREWTLHFLLKVHWNYCTLLSLQFFPKGKDCLSKQKLLYEN